MEELKISWLVDVEVFDRLQFKDYLHGLNELVKEFSGEFVKEFSLPEIVEGDWRPRTLLLIFEFEDKAYFNRFKNSSQLRNLRYQFNDVASFKSVIMR
ncbi:MAG: DUF1330 domain-containing protein [Bacteroidales bacterium]|jgi:uncharacterized protein (DUF1330 family)|nr:DUF1330 domain-containing protein [Bacteroidales bacterium]